MRARVRAHVRDLVTSALPNGEHRSARGALSEPAFRSFLLANAFAPMAQMLFAVALAWHVYELTGEALHLGGIGLIQFLATFGLSLVGGAVADAYDRVRILILQQLAMLACGLTLWFVTASDGISLVFLYFAAAISSAAGAFANPASSAILPTLVPTVLFPRAVTLSASVRQAARMSGPLVFGVVLEGWGLASTYLLQATLCGLAFATLWVVRPRYGSGERREVSLASVREGVEFVLRRPVIWGSMSLDMVAVVFAGAVALFPIYAMDILDVGGLGYGILAAALDLGTVGMGFMLVWLPPIRRAGRALLLAVGAFGVATIAFGSSTEFWLSTCALVVAGMADQVSMVARSLIIQLSTPDALRGRVSSVNMIFIGASNQLGAAESGFPAAATSAPFTVVFGGFACLATLAVATVKIPELRAYEVPASD